MKSRVVLAALSALLLAGGALTGAYPSFNHAGAPLPAVALLPAEAAKCAALEKRFDLSIAPRAAAAMAKTARALRRNGDALCRDGRVADGVHELQQALIDINVRSAY